VNIVRKTGVQNDCLLKYFASGSGWQTFGLAETLDYNGWELLGLLWYALIFNSVFLGGHWKEKGGGA